MELMKGGELFDYVVEKGTLSEEEASDLVRRLASAIAYMHSMEIIHRDLKPGKECRQQARHQSVPHAYFC